MFLKVVVLSVALLQGVIGQNVDCVNEISSVCDEWGCSDIAAALTTVSCGGTDPRCTLEQSYTLSGSTEIYETVSSCADDATLGYLCSFSSPTEAACTLYCNTASCNNIYEVGTTTTTAASCVQCTSEDDTAGACYTGTTAASTCALTTHQYCSEMHTYVMDSSGANTHEVVWRGCSDTNYDDGCWVDNMQIDANGGGTYATAVSCSKTGTANNDAAPFNMKGSGRTCKKCLAEHGACVDQASLPDMKCPEGQDYCYQKVIYTYGNYYNEFNDAVTEDNEVQILYEERGCTDQAVTTTCDIVNEDVAGSNFNVYSCEETCQTDECNDDWPMRPQCSQCWGSIWDSTGSLIADTSEMHFQYCKNNPPHAQRCPNPSQTTCFAMQSFVPDGDMEVKWGYPKTFTRGCITDEERSGHNYKNKCIDRKYRDEKEAKQCMFMCTEDSCNVGSDAVSTALSLLTGLFCICLTILL